jgi:coenzyme F420-reducing hydrogenase gamma subunit
MTILPKCPSCGLESAEIRCPRCNTLKLIGCSGGCATCGSSCPTGAVPASGASCPSDEAAEDSEQMGTPLTR